MKNILLTIESIIIVVFCISWCFALQRNQDNLIKENNDLKKALFEFMEKTEREIRIVKQDIQFIENGGVVNVR